MDIKTSFLYKLRGRNFQSPNGLLPNPDRPKPWQIVTGRLILSFDLELKNKRLPDTAIRDELKTYIGELIDYKISSVELKINYHRRPARIDISINSVLRIYPVPENSAFAAHTEAVMKLAALRGRPEVMQQVAGQVAQHLHKLDKLPAADYAHHKSIQKSAKQGKKSLQDLERNGLSAVALVEISREYGPDGLGI